MPNSLFYTMPQLEPLPAYRRDPETSSIRSSAPSYTSEAPSYHSTVPVVGGLAPATYAPGFRNVRNPDRCGLAHLNFNINQWSSAYSSPQARHYHNVAARRTNLAMIEEQNMLSSLSGPSTFPILNLQPTAIPEARTATASNGISPASVDNVPSSSVHVQQSASISQSPPPSIEPLSPFEDPDLVGETAATAARERRLYIATENRARRQQEEREALALTEEARRWDFLLAQMADWEDRERGWKAFSDRLEKKSTKSSTKRVLFRFWK